MAFASLLLWLIFLFSTLGISSSDFFCPNLGTLANVLGLEENVAGVTFLAFGNGSPDVFSTFAAMRSNTASLAIGELLGAASFIVSVVVGSMCIIKPFSVDPYPFLRDVGFFTAAVALIVAMMWDGELRLWETLTLTGLYFLYVLVVVFGTWWSQRRERKRALDALVRQEYAEEGPHSPYRDDESIEDDHCEYCPTSRGSND
jgi:solute carrier family 24 (sodium/potassium/calcium exchanger), member 6